MAVEVGKNRSSDVLRSVFFNKFLRSLFERGVFFVFPFILLIKKKIPSSFSLVISKISSDLKINIKCVMLVLLKLAVIPNIK
jgi:hypothetical protein